MPGNLDPSSKFEKLRQKAEELIQKQPGLSAETSSDILELVHELNIHQTELEIQNEELQQAQQELSILHQEYEDLYEFAPCGYVTLNSKGIVTHANLAAVTLLQTTRHTLLHSAFSQYIDSDSADVLLSARRKAGETGKEQRVEVLLKTEKETPTWAHMDIKADRDANDAVMQWRVVIMDFTAYKQVEDALLLNQYFLQKAQEIGQIGTWELDIKKNKLIWTDENYRIFGIPIGKALSYETFLSCVHPDDREYVDRKWKAAIKKKPYDIEHRLLIDGKVKWVREKAELEFNERDECIKGIGCTQDITELKRMDEIHKIHQQRKALSKELITLLERDRHHIAMELHDHIGQILTSLKLNLELAIKEMSTESTELKGLLNTAQIRASRALKDVKRISHGLRPATLDKLGLVPSLQNMFMEYRKEWHMPIEFFNNNVPEQLNGDLELALYRIVQEGVNNVIKHANAEKVYVNLIGKVNTISLSIEDNGAGFDRGKTVDGSDNRALLGLKIMQERAEQLGGEFHFETSIGKGTLLMADIPIKLKG